MGVTGVALGTLGVAFAPGAMDAERGIENPFAIDSGVFAVADGDQPRCCSSPA